MAQYLSGDLNGDSQFKNLHHVFGPLKARIPLQMGNNRHHTRLSDQIIDLVEHLSVPWREGQFQKEVFCLPDTKPGQLLAIGQSLMPRHFRTGNHLGKGCLLRFRKLGQSGLQFL